MIPIRQFDTLLQTQSLNNKLPQTLIQGSEDTEINAVIQQDGKNIQIDKTAKIEISVLYNGGTSKTYVTDETKSDFPAVIEDDGTITIKFNEMMTTVYGVHKLFLRIVDTNTSYALALDYEVLKNDAYNPQSTPNNLPSYNTVVAELPNKLNKDFSNSDDVAFKAKLSSLGVSEDDTPEQVRDKIQSLRGDNRLDNSAVKNSLGNDLADIDLAKLDEKFKATDSGKQLDLNSKTIGTKLDTDMGNVNTLLFSREMKLTSAYQDLAKRPSGSGKTAQEIRDLFEANRFEEQNAVDFSESKFSATTLYMAYQFTSNNQTILQELPAVSDNKIIMVEALLSTGISNPTLTFTAKSGDTIQGGSIPYTITGKNGYLGYFIPLINENTWQFIPHEISHEFSFVVSDDKGNSHFGINSIEFEKATVTEDGGILKVEPDVAAGGEMTFIDSQEREFKAKKIQSLSKKIRISNLGGVADLDANYDNSLDGVFAKLINPEPINTNFHDQRPYFGDRYEKMEDYIGYDMKDKAFTIQEGDDLDPNITGGTNFRLGFYFEPENNPTASDDGYVELKVIDLATGDYFLDDDGEPVAVRREYKAGEVIQHELLVSSIKAKGQVKIAFEIDCSFGGQIIVASDNTCVYIQAVDKTHNTGLAEVIFQQKANYNIQVHHTYYGVNFMNFAAALVKTKGWADLDDQHEILGNGLFISSKGKANVSIANYQLTIKDNGTDLPIFSVGKLLNQRETRALWNKTLNATVKITDKKNAFDYSLMQWSGDGEPVFPILTGYQNEQPIFAAGWTRVQNKFIPEDVVSGVHTDTNAFTVPEDAKQVAMMIYPHDSAVPTTLILDDFELDVSPAFTESHIGSFIHGSEFHLEYADYAYKSIVSMPGGAKSYSFTVGDTATKMPVGVFSGGDGAIFNDNAWADAGAFDPNKVQGDFKFRKDGTVKVNYLLRIKNRTDTENDVNLWIEKVGGSEVPNSRYTGKIAANTKVATTKAQPKFSMRVKAGESYRLFAQSDKADGFYVVTTNLAYPMIKIVYDFKEVEEKKP